MTIEHVIAFAFAAVVTFFYWHPGLMARHWLGWRNKKATLGPVGVQPSKPWPIADSPAPLQFVRRMTEDDHVRPTDDDLVLIDDRTPWDYPCPSCGVGRVMACNIAIGLEGRYVHAARQRLCFTQCPVAGCKCATGGWESEEQCADCRGRECGPTGMRSSVCICPPVNRIVGHPV